MSQQDPTDQARDAWVQDQKDRAAHAEAVAIMSRGFLRDAGYTKLDDKTGKEVVDKALLRNDGLKHVLQAQVQDESDINRVGLPEAPITDALLGLPTWDSLEWHKWCSEDPVRADAWEHASEEIWRLMADKTARSEAKKLSLTLVKTRGTRNAVSRVYVTDSEQVILDGLAAVKSKAVRQAVEDYTAALAEIGETHPLMLPALDKLRKKTLRLGKGASDTQWDEVVALPKGTP